MENFRPTGINLARISCGAFMFPHVLHMIAFPASWSPSAGAVIFFQRAGFWPADEWVQAAAAGEALLAAALMLGLWTRFVAPLAAGFLLVAAWGIHRTQGLLWREAGIEYALFWAVICVAVAIDAWQKRKA
jgi:putative oxidoreductase